MKKIGIVGGLGPEATVDYYKRITSFFQNHNKGLSTPEIIVYSVDISELFDLVSKGQWKQLAEWQVAKIKALKDAGADFAIISANTPHIVFDQVLDQSPLPLISIVDATLSHAQSLGLKRLGLLGTKFTMQANFFDKRFSQAGISVLVPSDEEQNFIQDKLVTEVELGVFTDSTRAGLLEIIETMKGRDNIDGIILGCTELPLILDKDQFGLHFLNTTAIHVDSVCQYCLAD